MENHEKTLTESISDAKMEFERLQALLSEKEAEMKREEILKKHTTPITFLEGRGRWTTRVNGKQKTLKSRKELPPLPIHQELGYMVDYGITPMEAIRTATYNAASVLGIENETGSLKEGLAGDLLIVKGDVSKNIRALDDVQEVYLAGEIVYTV